MNVFAQSQLLAFEAAGEGSPLDLVRAFIWAYIVGSILLLYGVRRLRLYPLYLLKSAWTLFTVVAFAWVVMMSGATNEELLLRPAGPFGELRHYPSSFERVYDVGAWWLPAMAWIPLWATGGLLPPGSTRRRNARIALTALTVVQLVPLVALFANFDWSVYSHFRENYTLAWQVGRLGKYFLNSLLVTTSAVVLVTIVGAMTAYGLTRLEFRGRKQIMGTFIAAMSVPSVLLLVPLFLMMKDWSIGSFSFANSRTGLAVIYAATTLPFTTFLLSAFFESLPRELAKAAVMDGAKPWRIFTDVYFPLCVPGLSTAAIFNFLGIWNEYNYALVLLTNVDAKTLPIGLYGLYMSQIYASNWAMLCAGIVILVLPTFVIFAFLQDKIVAGLTVGGVKE